MVHVVWRLATVWTTEESEFESLVEARIITSPCRLDLLWGTPSLLSVGTSASFAGGKAYGA
jgi:hypothetical protein